LSGEPNAYAVKVSEGAHGWEVQILEPGGDPAWSRACGDEAEARTFASTVQQHIYWLSPAKFREYYRLAEPA
jgi:hypothetical protein